MDSSRALNLNDEQKNKELREQLGIDDDDSELKDALGFDDEANENSVIIERNPLQIDFSKICIEGKPLLADEFDNFLQDEIDELDRFGAAN